MRFYHVGIHQILFLNSVNKQLSNDTRETCNTINLFILAKVTHCLSSNKQISLVFDWLAFTVIRFEWNEFRNTNNFIIIYSEAKLSNFEYAVDVVPLSEDFGKLQVFPYHLTDTADIAEMNYAPLKCDTPIQDYSGLKPNYFSWRGGVGLIILGTYLWPGGYPHGYGILNCNLKFRDICGIGSTYTVYTAAVSKAQKPVS